MGKILLVVFVGLSISNVFAQSQRGSINGKELKYGVSVSAITTTKAFLLSPSFVVETKKHSFALSPLAGLEYGHEKRIIGGYFSYQFYPNAKQNMFNLFFSYDLNFFGFDDNVVLYGVRTFHIQNTIGYGFKLKLFSSFYFIQNFGLGFVYTRKEFESIESHSPESLKKYNATGLLKFGLGYEF